MGHIAVYKSLQPTNGKVGKEDQSSTFMVERGGTRDGPAVTALQAGFGRRGEHGHCPVGPARRCAAAWSSHRL